MRRYYILFLCFALLLTGCVFGTDESTDTTTAEKTEEATEEIDSKLYAVENGAPLFTIVYGKNDHATHADYMASVLKSKTGVTFKVVNDPAKAKTPHKIYVGLHDGVESMYELYNGCISYDGYGAIRQDGDVYICGYNEMAVGKAAKKFLSEMIAEHILKDENGKTQQAYFADSLFFLKNPTYKSPVPNLLGLPISDYTVVWGKMPDLAVKQIAQLCVDRIGKNTGAFVRAMESSEQASRIELIFDEDLELFQYKIGSAEQTISLRFGGMCALYAAFDALMGLDAENASSEISLEQSATETVLSSLPLALESDADLRVMSANVLGPGSDEGNKCSSEVRAALMAEYIMALSPDSVGLQEYYGSYTSEFEAVVSKKYAVVSFDSVIKPMVATIYRKDRYTLLDSNAINIKAEEFPGDPNAQNYYFTWIVLQDAAGERYIHANLHLDYRTDELRLKQCEMINTELQSVLEKYPNAVLVVTGDYNASTTGSRGIFDTIKGEFALESAELCAPEGKRDYSASYHNLCAYENLQTSVPSAIDHVMVSTDTATVALHKIINDELICHAGDHCPVLADVIRSK